MKRPDREGGSTPPVNDSAIGLHEGQRAGISCILEVPIKIVDIGREERFDIRVQNDCRRPLELAPLCHDIRGCGDRKSWITRADPADCCLLMCRIGVRMEKADRNRLDSLLYEKIDLTVKRVDIHRLLFRPVRANAFANFTS